MSGVHGATLREENRTGRARLRRERKEGKAQVRRRAGSARGGSGSRECPRRVVRARSREPRKATDEPRIARAQCAQARREGGGRCEACLAGRGVVILLLAPRVAAPAAAAVATARRAAVATAAVAAAHRSCDACPASAGCARRNAHEYQACPSRRARTLGSRTTRIRREAGARSQLRVAMGKVAAVAEAAALRRHEARAQHLAEGHREC